MSKEADFGLLGREKVERVEIQRNGSRFKPGQQGEANDRRIEGNVSWAGSWNIFRT